MALHWSDAVMDALSGRVLPVGLAATGPVPPSAERVLRRSEWVVDTLDLGQGRDLVEREHYAAGSSNTATFRHGLFRREEWPLVPLGAALWIPPTRAAAEATWHEWQRVLSLSRFVLDQSVPKNGASFLLARSTRLIERDGRWDCLVTYADEWQGHTGTIYRAAGWEYVGLTKPERVYVLDGRMVARKAGPKTRTHADMLDLGAECVGSFARHKFRKILRGLSSGGGHRPTTPPAAPQAAAAEPEDA